MTHTTTSATTCFYRSVNRARFAVLALLLCLVTSSLLSDAQAQRIAAPQWRFSIGHGPLPRPWFDTLAQAVEADNIAVCQQCTQELAPYGGWCTDCYAVSLRFDFVVPSWAGDGYRTHHSSWPPGTPPQTVGPDIGRASGAVEIRCPVGYFYDDRDFCWADDATIVQEELGGECTKGSCCVGNPIDPGSLVKFQVETDYAAPNQSLLKLKRYYNNAAYSGSAAQGALWRHDFSARIGVLGEAASTSQGVFYSLLVSTPSSYVVAPLRRSSVGANPLAAGFAQLALIRPSGAVVRLKSEASLWVDQERAAFSARAGAGVDSRWIVKDHTANLVEQYSETGRLTKRSLPDGRSVELTYDTFGRLSSASDQFGKSLLFRYDIAARITEALLPGGSSVIYQYDGPTQHVPIGWSPQSALTGATYPDGWRRLYHYNEPAHTGNNILPRAMTGVSEEVAPDVFTRFATYTYQWPGRPVSTTHAGGANRYLINYLVPYQRTAITDPLGTVRTVHYAAMDGNVARTANDQPAGAGSEPCSDALTYDGRVNITSRTDFRGNKICYAYDPSRNLETKRVEALTAFAVCSTALSSPPATSRVISTEWHPDWRLETLIAEPKKFTTITYNGQGASCAPGDALVDGRPIAVVCSRTERGTTDESGAAGFSATATGTARTWRYTYTTYGRVLTATDPNNRTTTTSYHADNDPDLGKRGNVASITNAANHTTYLTDYNPHGQPTRIVDPNGVVTVLTYDPRMRLTSRTVGNEATVFGYDPVGQMTSVNVSDGARLTYTYDAAHRLTAINDHKGNRVDYTLDAMGNRINEQMKDPGGVLVQNIARVIDALNRLERVTGAQ